MGVKGAATHRGYVVGPKGISAYILFNELEARTDPLGAELEELSGGDIYIGGRKVNDLAPRDRNIAMVFQSYALYPHMSVFDNMDDVDPSYT